LLAPEEAEEGALEELWHPAPTSAPKNISGNANCLKRLFMVFS
jgi:hypothetical protein